jgi:exopolysaccharide biosynthesis predicted pyruvyltransferase EpsI
VLAYIPRKIIKALQFSIMKYSIICNFTSQAMSLENFVKSFSNNTIYYCPNPGNAGDALIALSTYQLFNRLGLNYGIAKFGQDLSDKVIFYGGGGQLIKLYQSHALNFLLMYKDVAKKLVFLPSTINIDASIISDLRDNVEIVCRERTSYEYIKKCNNRINVHLFDDVAFLLDIDDALNRDLKRSNFSISGLKHYYHLVKFMYNTNVKGSSRTSNLNSFRTDIEKTSIHLPEDNYDISSQFGALEFDERLSRAIGYQILKYINGFNSISTNRLHIAIGGAILGKQVAFYPNSYYKNKAVYEYSLKNKFPNVQWAGE